ncbi:hypothetical protein [Fodinicola feengrottensis]|uniref:hypothetical protein n=1 Tax=Fodinicola feengrottensis TaxID=435914 RepID=UPI0024430BBE|nr:hypothetical protein [Fodinicola feengrottensis]
MAGSGSKVSTLPKVRDGLYTLLTGPLALPLGLDESDVRAQVAASLESAWLLWVDEESTANIDHLSQSLPPTCIEEPDLPSSHGLVSWGRPVGVRGDLVAATWTTTPAGIRVVGYGSIGTGVPPAALQDLRGQIGWIVPRSHIHLAPAQRVDARSAVSSLVTTWIFLAQRIAETRSIPVDKGVRKSYQRSGRPPAEVRLIRLTTAHRPDPRMTTPVQRAPDQDNAALPAAATTDPPTDKKRRYDHRWWVAQHTRKQPYGPGRTQIREITVKTHLRGPDDKPIKLSTTVRILGGIHPEASPENSGTLPPAPV